MSDLPLTNDPIAPGDAWLRALVQSLPDVFFRYRIADPPGFEYLAPSSAELLGYAPKEILTDLALAHRIIHPDDWNLLQRLAAQESAQAYPITIRTISKEGRVIWTELYLQFEYDGEGRPLAVQGVAHNVTARKTIELEREQLLLSEQEARLRAERNADQLARLQNVTAALSGALADEQVAKVIFQQGFSLFPGCYGGLVRIAPDGETLELMASYSQYPTETLDSYRRFSIRAATIAAQAARTGELVYVRSRQELDERFPEVARLGGIELYKAWAGVPLLLENRPVGALGLSFVEPIAFDEQEQQYMLALGRQAALALERARLFRKESEEHAAAETASEKLTFLSEASAILASSLDYETTLQRVADLAIPRLGDWCAVDLLQENGALKLVAVAHADPEKVKWARELRLREPVDMSAPTGIPQVIRTGRSEFYSQIPDSMLAEAARDEEHLALLHKIGLRALMIVPLTARDRTFGAMTLISGQPGRTYSRADLELAEELSRRAGFAIDNARLYDEAQTAIRLRDQFFAVASHELKTPLTSLIGYTELLRRQAAAGGAFDEMSERMVNTLFQQAQRLDRMISALLDASRLDSGKLTLEYAAFDLRALAERLVNETRPGLHKHSLELNAPQEPFIMDGDELRIEQVLQNLLQNAIRYSPAGGTVCIELVRAGDYAQLSVSDEGIGIPAEAIPHLFDRFYRAGNAQTAGISGLGMGLYIVQELVSLHGGSISVQSEEGQGATFTLRLPLLPASTT